MDKEKRKNSVRGRTNKGGRPVKGATEKLKYRVTVKMATEDYYLLKSKAKSAGVSASEFIRGCITFVPCRTLVIEIDNLIKQIRL